MDRLETVLMIGSLIPLFIGLLFIPEILQAQDENGTIVITAEEIGRMKANKMVDILNQVPGVTAGDSSVGIHGSYKVKVLVDGRPINDPASSYGAINWSLVNPDQIERIEILRGKGGVRYGQDAGGGVILITTRRITNLTGMVKVYGGSQDTGFGSANLQANSGRLGVAVNGETEYTQGYTVNNDGRRHKGGTKISYTADEDRSLSLAADYLNDERGLTGLPDYPTPFARKENDMTALSAQARYFTTTSSTFFNSGHQRNQDISRELDQTLRVNELGEDLASSITTGKFSELAYGIGYKLGQASGSTFSDQSEEAFSLFASQSLQQKGRPFLLTAGLRANANSVFDDTLNPELKAVYRQDVWNLTASYSGSTNTPSFYQRYNHSSSTRPNPDLDMETADNYSLALFVQPRSSLSGRVSLFYNLLTDRITYVTGDDGIGQYQNFGEVSYQGGDLSFTWQALASLSIKATYTYLEATDEETGLIIPSKAKHQAAMDLYWQAMENWTTVLSGKYASDVYLNKTNTKTIPEYFLANIRTEYSFGPYAVFAEIKNLCDKTYLYSDGLLAPPRTWLLGLSWKF